MGAEKAPPEPKVCVNTAQLIGGLSKCIHQKWFTSAALFPRLVTKEAEHLAVCSHSGGAAAGDNFAALLPQRVPPLLFQVNSSASACLQAKTNATSRHKLLLARVGEAAPTQKVRRSKDQRWRQPIASLGGRYVHLCWRHLEQEAEPALKNGSAI